MLAINVSELALWGITHSCLGPRAEDLVRKDPRPSSSTGLSADVLVRLILSLCGGHRSTGTISNTPGTAGSTCRSRKHSGGFQGVFGKLVSQYSPSVLKANRAAFTGLFPPGGHRLLSGLILLWPSLTPSIHKHVFGTDCLLGPGTRQ